MHLGTRRDVLLPRAFGNLVISGVRKSNRSEFIMRVGGGDVGEVTGEDGSNHNWRDYCDLDLGLSVPSGRPHS